MKSIKIKLIVSNKDNINEGLKNKTKNINIQF